MEAQVRKPDPNHYHWGLVLTGDCMSSTSWETAVDRAMKLAADNGWLPFHQGGYHESWEECRNRHYLEFWNLPGDEDHGEAVEQYIKRLFLL